MNFCGETFISLMLPYHVRTQKKVPFQQYYLIINNTSPRNRISELVLHLSDSTLSTATAIPFVPFKLNTPSHTISIARTLLLDEINKKLYFVHCLNSDSDFVIHEGTMEMVRMFDGHRKVIEIHSIRTFLGRSDFSKLGYCDGGFAQCFINSFDGSIMQICSANRDDSVVTSYRLIWIKLDASDTTYDNVSYNGKAKIMDEIIFKFDRLNVVDSCECGILFNKNGKKMLMRFRLTNPDKVDQLNLPSTAFRSSYKDDISNPDSRVTHEMTKPPTYALFGLDYDTQSIQLLTKFELSPDNHCDLLISNQLLSVYANTMGLPIYKARSIVSQRSLMIGQYLKYTFFSTINNDKIGILAVKSLMKTIQYGILTQKKVWFPLDDERVKSAFAELPNRMISWKMLSNKTNQMMVVGDEFIIQVFDSTGQSGTIIRVKMGDEYRDYRKCAGCGNSEQHKRRNKNGKRISQFKVCGWCKDQNLHKASEIPCHYCSEECADNDWPRHQLEHNKKNKGKKGKGKKKKNKNK